MASCFISNPSSTTLMACSIFGAGLSLVGVPFIAYKSAPHFCKALDNISRNKNANRVAASFGDKLDQYQSTVRQAVPFLQGYRNRKVAEGYCYVSYGCIFMLSSSMFISNHAISSIKKYKSNPLIRNVCCNRIRFFAIVALVEGFSTGVFVAGSYLTARGMKQIQQYKK